MSDIPTKAIELYWRGWPSKEIKKITGVSSMMVARRVGNRKTNALGAEKLAEYIKNHYSADEIEAAIKEGLEVPTHLRAKHELLGSYFIHFAETGRLLLGADAYNALSKKVSRKHWEDSMMKTYGSTSPNGNPEIMAKTLASMRKTNQKKYGVDYPSQREDVAEKITAHRQATMLEKYGAANTVQSDALRAKLLDSRHRNGNLTTSKPESALGIILKDAFGSDDVIHQYQDSRYPFYADYYIKSLDLFIELNGDKGHGGHWFDAEDPTDIKTLKHWESRRDELSAGKPEGYHSRYENYIKMWTKSDVEKRRIAAQNKLNYLVFWDVSRTQVDHKYQYDILDAQEWISKGHPMPDQWHKQNTY